MTLEQPLDMQKLGKTVHFHIGQGRGVTSSVQQFLRDHPEQLHRHNAVYPKLPKISEDLPSEAASHSLVAYLREVAGQPGPRDYGRLRMVADFLSALPQEHIVLSSAYLVHLSLEPLIALRDTFADRGLRIVVYCYIQDPFDAVLSYYSQKIANGATVDVNEYLRQAQSRKSFGSPLLTHLDTLHEAFGKQLVIRPFQRDKLVGGDVRMDFLHSMGFEPAASEMPKDLTYSVNAFEIEAMRQLNQLTGAGTWSTKKNRDLLEYTRDEDLHGPSISDFVDPQVERDIRAFFEPEVAAIKDKYFADLIGPLFSTPALYPDFRPHQDSLDISKLMRTIVNVLVGQQKKSARARKPLRLDLTEKASAPPASGIARHGSLNIFACADQNYEDFASIFIASCLWSNPGVTVEIGVEDPDRFMSVHGAAIAPLRAHFGPDSFLIRKGYFLRPSGKSILPNSVRFVTTPIIKSDYVYIGDIDIIVLEPILEAHLGHMSRTGLPFSNSIRPGSKRLTGLHFTRYDALYPLPEFDDLLETKLNDEMLLTILVRRKIGEFPPTFERFRPLHGIHVSPNRPPNSVFPSEGMKKQAGWDWGAHNHLPEWGAFRSTTMFKQMEPHLSERIKTIVAQVDEFQPRQKALRPDVSSASATASQVVPASVAVAEIRPIDDASFRSTTATSPPPQDMAAKALNPTATTKKLLRLIREERWDEACTLQSRMLRERPDDASQHFFMGQILAKSGEPQKAVSYLRYAHEKSPDEPRYAAALSRVCGQLGDRANQARFRALAEQLAPAREQAFMREQETAKAAALNDVRSTLAECLPSWRYATSTDSATPIADKLFAAHSIDAGKWSRHMSRKFRLGDVAVLEHIGHFQIRETEQTIYKRLVHGLPWELPATALFMELASRCDPGAVVIDVGANIGTHTVALARMFPGRVLAFEPVPSSHEYLLENLALNSLDNVIPSRKACGAVFGTGSMERVQIRNPGKARLSSGPGPVEVTTVDAEVERIGRPAALMKIDVEGGEKDVIAGAQQTIQRDRPIIFCEIIGDERSREMSDQFAKLGYNRVHFTQNDWLFFPS